MEKKHALIAFAILLIAVVVLKPNLPSPSGAAVRETTRYYVTCEEGDGGFDLDDYSMVTVTKNGGATATVEDHCTSSYILREFSCYGNTLTEQSVRCDNGCKDGACL
jgi:hypothetical protein|tara:strand:+ start:5092 stop:5412 length:321 start_codon:yes stop_codon:yes gene_type:complete